MSYQIASKSQKGRKKEAHERNGDYCAWLEEKQCIVLALADGVGTCTDDARASKTACTRFVEKCRIALSQDEILNESKLIEACKSIDPVLAVDGDLACFCAVVWSVNSDRAIWIHVGDTRIYKYSKGNGLQQITSDDHAKAVNIKLNGKLYTDHGALVAAVPIDNAIGDKKCNYHTGTFSFYPGESIILCSDGMYGSSGFFSDVESLLEKPDVEKSIVRIDTTDDDDASLLILRRNMMLNTNASFRELMDNYDEYCKTIPLNSLIDRFYDELKKMLATHDDFRGFAEAVSFMKENQMYLDRKRIDEIYNASVQWEKTAEGDEKQILYNACLDLKEILKYAFTH